ncbi:hypothetical protein LX99_04925 [Mucilaginibacter oryzae]|uniref:Uncharacterized protein n=1 Tax=Mucilaginibacter oryzae TaxID=468058 RepID=A0A316GW25_9SPHI|nr:hypothetical protein [Mucilaginibacter oryzae]PWK67067.1 hypothetical protein LX99_04925 [Mucilaginibacter oryzae]
MDDKDLNFQLDTVLSILRARSKNLGGIQSYLKDAFQIELSQSDVQGILDKLKEDGLITIDDDSNHICRISMNGKYYSGYQQQQDNETTRRILDETTIIYQREQTDTLNRLTGYLVIASVVASVYYLIEILKSVYPLLKCH